MRSTVVGGLTVLGLMLCAGLQAIAASTGNLTVTFSSISTGSVVNLTQQGALDWVHWGLYTETSVDRKASVTPQISDFELADATNGFSYAYQFGDNENGYSWSDGTPHVAVTNTTTGVWAYGTPQIGSGFRFTVPAGTNMQTLKVYVGSFGAKGRFEATLSDGSGGYTNPANATVNNIANGPSAVYAVNYAANSPGQTLTVTYTLVQFFRPDGNVTLQSAALTAPGANNLPFVVLTSPAEGASVTAPTNLTLTASTSDADGFVSVVEFYAGTNKIGESTTAPYAVVWTNPAPGAYTLTARVVDDSGGVGVSAPVHVFVSGTGGSLTSSRTTPPTALDLTAEGTSDWAHWGFLNASNFNHKIAGASQISDVTRIGDRATQRYEDNYTAFSWSDGTPVTSTGPTNVGVFVSGLTNGFEITAPADTNARTLRVYVGLYGAQGNFEAYLSDFSARALADTSLSNVFNNSYAVYTINYAAASAGQRIVVRYTVQNLYDFDFGNVTFQAATLQGPIPPHDNFPPLISITSPTNNSTFVAPASFTIDASATDPDGTVAQVEFINGTTSLGIDTSSPYSAVVSGLAAGTYTLRAVATDNSGASATNSVTITVTNVPANNPPTVLITSPTNGSAFSAPASFTIQASASDSDGTVTQVQFFNGTTSLGIDTSSPYSASVSSLAAGSFTLRAIVTDNAGASATNSVTITVTNVPVNNPPTVLITSPTNGSAFSAPASFTIQAGASDSDGTVTQVQFFNGTTSLGIDTSSPYSASVSSLAVGSYTLRAIATDNAGASATNSVTITVTNVPANNPPTVLITSPTNRSIFTAPASFTIQASASDSDGTVTQVQFFNGTTSLGIDTSSPYSASVSGFGAGSYTLRAIATDNAGAMATNSVTISVGTNAPQATTITSPQLVGSAFVFSFGTQTGVTYSVDFTPTLNPIVWQMVTSFVATGSSATVTNATAPGQTFYRVRAN